MDERRTRLERELDAAARRVAVLEAGLAEITAASVSSNADDEHDPEGATIAFERQQQVALLGLAARTLEETRAALRTLDSGDYGRCVHCAHPIGAGRLEARPRARSCVDCARDGRD